MMRSQKSGYYGPEKTEPTQMLLYYLGNISKDISYDHCLCCQQMNWNTKFGCKNISAAYLSIKIPVTKHLPKNGREVVQQVAMNCNDLIAAI